MSDEVKDLSQTTDTTETKKQKREWAIIPEPTRNRISQLLDRLAKGEAGEKDVMAACRCAHGKAKLVSLPMIAWYIIESCLDRKVVERKRAYDLKDIFDAILYITRTGCQWRLLPSEYPPYRLVFYYFSKWKKDNVFRDINEKIVFLCRGLTGREECPSLTILDSRTVAGSHHQEKELTGYDGGKKTKGRKQQIVVDCHGFILGVHVHAADVHDSVGGRKAVEKLKPLNMRDVIKLLVDMGYRGEGMREAAEKNGWIIEVRLRNQETKQFVVEPMRWVVERTNSWMENFRRLTRDYERTNESVEAFLTIANLWIMGQRIDAQFVKGEANAIEKGINWKKSKAS